MDVERLKVGLEEKVMKRIPYITEIVSDFASGVVQGIASGFQRYSSTYQTNQYLEQQTDRVLERYQQIKQEDSDFQLLAFDLRGRVQATYSDIDNQSISKQAKQDLKEEALREVIPEAYALVYGAIVKSNLESNKGEGLTIDELTRQQIKGGVTLYDNIIDMKTGEGKTLTALFPAYLKSLSGEGVHVNTVNDYLADRDYKQAQKVLEKLDVKVGVTLSDQGFKENRPEVVKAIQTEVEPKVRADVNKNRTNISKSILESEIGAMGEYCNKLVDEKHPDLSGTARNNKLNEYLNNVFNNKLDEVIEKIVETNVERIVSQRIAQENRQLKTVAYQADITYGFHAEFAFDFLKDNTQGSVLSKVNPLKRFGYAIIDEIDNILIDEGQTPHVLSGDAKKTYSDEKMYEVRDVVLKFMGEQSEKVSASEEKLVGLDQLRCTRQKDLIESYAQQNEVSPQQVLGELNENGSHLELRVKLNRVEEDMGEGFGKELFLLRHMTANSKILDSMFDRYKPQYFRYANKPKEGRKELLADLDYIVDHNQKRLELTDKGLEKLYESGVLGTGELIIDSETVKGYLAKKGEEREISADDCDDYFDYLSTIFGISCDSKLMNQIQSVPFGEDVRIPLDSPENPGTMNLLVNFMQGKAFYREGKDYLVHNGEIILVDESGGRAKEGYRYRGGLHEALECLHDLKINDPKRTLGSTSLHRHFKLYEKMTGMSGSVLAVADELDKTYDVGTVAIEPSKPLIRKDKGLELFYSTSAKDKALVREVTESQENGRPILLGVSSVLEAKRYNDLLTENGITDIQVLTAESAKEDGFQEEELIRKAGKAGRVTIATNMAGRGTDIKLSTEAREKGGLHVMLSYMPNSTRSIDQFIGRAGRLGDPGSSVVYASIEDDTFSYFQGTKIERFLSRYADIGTEEESICSLPFMKKVIERSVRKVLGDKEGERQKQRETTNKFDELNGSLRDNFYGLRDEIIEDRRPLQILSETLTQEVEEMRHNPVINGVDHRARYQRALEILNQASDDVALNDTFVDLSLTYLDQNWSLLNEDLEGIRETIHLHAYAQRNPQIEYTLIGRDMYEEFETGFMDFLTNTLLQVR